MKRLPGGRSVTDWVGRADKVKHTQRCAKCHQKQCRGKNKDKLNVFQSERYNGQRSKVFLWVTLSKSFWTLQRRD